MKLTYILLTLAFVSALFAYAEPPAPGPMFHLTPLTVSDGQVASPAGVPVMGIPVPMPTYANPDTFQALGLKWIATATAIMAALSAFAAFVISKIGELRRALQNQREELGGRLDRTDGRVTAQQTQITTIATNALPPGSPQLALQAPGGHEEGETARTGLLGLGLALLVSASLMGCSTTTGNPATDARHAQLNAAGKQTLAEAEGILGRVAVSALYNVASQELSGGKADMGSAAAAGLWANVDATGILASAGRVADAYAGGKAPETAKAVNRALSGVRGTVTQEAISAVAAVISTAAGAPPAR